MYFSGNTKKLMLVGYAIGTVIFRILKFLVKELHLLWVRSRRLCSDMVLTGYACISKSMWAGPLFCTDANWHWRVRISAVKLSCPPKHRGRIHTAMVSGLCLFLNCTQELLGRLLAGLGHSHPRDCFDSLIVETVDFLLLGTLFDLLI